MYSLGNLSWDIHLWWREGSECRIYYLHIWIYYLTDDNFACCKYFGKYLGHGASLHYVGLSTHSRDNWLSVIVSQSLDSYPGGGGTPLYGLNGDVRPDRVWFSEDFVLNGVSISSIFVLNRVSLHDLMYSLTTELSQKAKFCQCSAYWNEKQSLTSLF